MEMAGVSPDEIGLIVVATSPPDYNTFPSTACLVQNLLGCANAGAFDLQAACAGFVYALEQARGFVNFYPERKALVIGGFLIGPTDPAAFCSEMAQEQWFSEMTKQAASQASRRKQRQ